MWLTFLNNRHRVDYYIFHLILLAENVKTYWAIEFRFLHNLASKDPNFVSMSQCQLLTGKELSRGPFSSSRRLKPVWVLDTKQYGLRLCLN